MSAHVPDAAFAAVEAGTILRADLAAYATIRHLAGRDGLDFHTGELADAIGVTKPTLLRTIERLAEAGLITYAPSTSRYRSSFIGIIRDTDETETQVVSRLRSKRLIGKTSDTDETDIGKTSDTDETKTPAASTGPELGEQLIGKTSDTDERRIKTSTSTSTGRPKTFYAEDSDAFRLATLLHTLITENLDRKARADLQVWAAHVDRLERLDGRAYDEIERVIRWLHESPGRDADFWRGNVLSTANLRKHFPRLVVKCNGKQPARALTPDLDEYERLG